MRITSDVIDTVVAHARDVAPAECCGLLVGRDDEIVSAVRTRNIADRPVEFQIDPRDHIDGRRKARQQGLDVLGFYHSHPHSPAEPSATDLADAGYPDHIYLIVSLAAAEPDVRAFRFERGNFHRVAFVTVR
jgi:proteasome lid subunit RPN8/RPN11